MKIFAIVLCIVSVHAQSILFYEARLFQFNQSQYSDTINLEPSDSLAVAKYLDFGDTGGIARGTIAQLSEDFNFRTLFQKNHINYVFPNSEEYIEPFQSYRKIRFLNKFDSLPLFKDSLGRINLVKDIEEDEVKFVKVASKVKNGKLWVRYKDYYMALFDRDSNKILQHTMYGNSLYLRSYKQVSFYNEIFENVHEFWVMLCGRKKTINFLVWFDDNYNAIRVESKWSGLLNLSVARRR